MRRVFQYDQPPARLYPAMGVREHQRLAIFGQMLDDGDGIHDVKRRGGEIQASNIAGHKSLRRKLSPQNRDGVFRNVRSGNLCASRAVFPDPPSAAAAEVEYLFAFEAADCSLQVTERPFHSLPMAQIDDSIHRRELSARYDGSQFVTSVSRDLAGVHF